jgi:aspartyl-tRNA(Asn)/glutamyl-tRNA(Gln) amidotransferase subunit C
MSTNVITTDTIVKTAKLAKLDVSGEDASVYATQLESILEHFDSLNKINVDDVVPTYQVTGLKSVMRDDEIDYDRMLSQAQALSNAPNKNGYFVTSATIKK